MAYQDPKSVVAHETANVLEAPKLTDWANEPSAGDLQEDLTAAKPAHDLYVSKLNKWNDLRKVTGQAAPKKIRGRSSVQPKLIRRQNEWRYPALSEPFNSSEQKLFKISPTTFEDSEAARQNELVINYQFRNKINRVNFIDNYVRANVDEGSAVVRLGWNRITKEEEIDVPVFEHLAPEHSEQVAALEQAVMLKAANPRDYESLPEEMKAAVDYFEESGQPTVAVIVGSEKQTIEKIIDNRPTLEVINPQNFYWDPSCGGDLDRAHFVIISFETSKAELLKEPNRYKNLDYVNWESASASTTSDPDHVSKSNDSNFNFKDPLRKRVIAYEYWGVYDVDDTGELKPIVSTWIGSTMIRMEENPFPDGKIPFVISNYTPILRELMGEPDAELLEDNQAVLGAVTRGMIDLLGRSANGQIGFAKGMLDVVNKRKYDNGQDYDYNPTIHPSQGVIEHKYPEIPQSAMVMAQSQNMEAEALTGVKAFSGGMSGEAYGDVAAGIRGILDAAAKREMSILRRLASGLVQVGKKMVAMNQAFMSEEEIVRISNKEFVTIKREDIQGDFDLIVDISTAEIDNNKAQDLSFMLQTIGPKGDFSMTKMILEEIATLKRMPELAEKIRTFEPQPDPMQQQLMQLQIQKEMKEIEKIQSEIKLNEAKAKKEITVADQNNLDTIEQETGTAHARALEQTGGQAKANQDLEVTKALLKARKRADGGETEPDVEAAAGWNQLSKTLNDPRNKDGLVPPPLPMVQTPPAF